MYVYTWASFKLLCIETKVLCKWKNFGFISIKYIRCNDIKNNFDVILQTVVIDPRGSWKSFILTTLFQLK